MFLIESQHKTLCPNPTARLFVFGRQSYAFCRQIAANIVRLRGHNSLTYLTNTRLEYTISGEVIFAVTIA